MYSILFILCYILLKLHSKVVPLSFMLLFCYIHAFLPSQQQTHGWLRELHIGEYLYIFPIKNYHGKSDHLFPRTATVLNSWNQELLVGFKPSEIPVLDGWKAHTGQNLTFCGFVSELHGIKYVFHIPLS